jgi:hypothetical protein
VAAGIVADGGAEASGTTVRSAMSSVTGLAKRSAWSFSALFALVM